MRKAVSLSEVIAWPLLWPGNMACRALGFGEHSELVRMLVNSLVWTFLGVVIVWMVA